MVASQAASPRSPSRPIRRINRKNKFTSPPVPESFRSPSTWPLVPTFAVETQEHITTKQGEDRIVSIRFFMGASTMVVLNRRLSSDELCETAYPLPGFTRVVGIRSLLHGVDLSPRAPDVLASAFPSP